jgi:Tfp pilus assembly protein PilZ
MIMRKQSLVRYPEKRRDTRAPFYSPILVEDLNAGYVYRARMVNYSKDGIFIETDVGLEPGEEIYIGIEDSPHKFSPDAARGYRAKVIWQKGLKNSIFNFGYGVIIVSGNDKKKSDKPPTREFQKRQELRRHPRKSFPKTVYFTSQNHYYRGSIDNISRGGIFIETRDVFTLGQTINLVIPGTKIDKGVMLKAEVVRFSEAGVGLAFKGVLKGAPVLDVNLVN